MHAAPLPSVDIEHHAQLERSLALVRAALALFALVTVLQNLPIPGEVTRFNARLVIGYTVYALAAGVLIAVLRPRPAVGALLHTGDVLWAVALTTHIEPLASMPSVFYLFALASAGYRWGLYEALLTGVAAAGLHAAVSSTSSQLPPVETGRLVTPSLYLLALSALIGYLADAQNRSWAQAAATARVLAAVDFGGGFRASVQRVLEILLASFHATEVVMLFEESASGRVYRWSLTNADRPVQLDELPGSEQETWMVPAQATMRAWRL